MARITDGIIEPGEASAARAVLSLAEEIQELCHNQDTQDIPPATVKALHRAYRVVRPITDFYFGAENTVLCWNPPNNRFQKGNSKC